MSPTEAEVTEAEDATLAERAGAVLAQYEPHLGFRVACAMLDAVPYDATVGWAGWCDGLDERAAVRC